MGLQVYDKINTLYKRYQFDGKVCPKKEWLKFKNRIIIGSFSNKEAEYLFDCMWEAYSKIDGTNSKIAFFPSTGDIQIGGKTNNASSQHGQFEMLQEIADRIQPELVKMFPKESARFTPVKSKETNKVQYYDMGVGYPTAFNPDATLHELGNDELIGKKNVAVELEEIPVYIYGEYFGAGIQKCGKRYLQNCNDFLVFDICQQGWWLPKEMRDSICKTLNLKTVPYIGTMSLRDIEKMVMGGFQTKYEDAADPSLLEEGIVARPVIPLRDARGDRIIVKVKLCDYLEYQQVRSEFTDEEFKEFSEWYKTIEIV